MQDEVVSFAPKRIESRRQGRGIHFNNLDRAILNRQAEALREAL